MKNEALQIETSPGMGAWFASLSAYNSGRLVGGWVYPLEHDSFESFYQAIKRVTRGHDEVAIHDYDNCPDMGEFPNHVDLYNLIHAIEDSYIDNEILIKYMDNQCNSAADLLEEAERFYITTADTFKDFAYEQAEQDIENTVNAEAVQFVFNNFDYDGYARDLEHDYTVIELDNYDVAIFSNC